jgi:hypothetical protein
MIQIAIKTTKQVKCFIKYKIEHLKCFCTFGCFPDHHGGGRAMERDGIPSRHSLRCIFRAEVYCFDLSISLWVYIDRPS